MHITYLVEIGKDLYRKERRSSQLHCFFFHVEQVSTSSQIISGRNTATKTLGFG